MIKNKSKTKSLLLFVASLLGIGLLLVRFIWIIQQKISQPALQDHILTLGKTTIAAQSTASSATATTASPIFLPTAKPTSPPTATPKPDRFLVWSATDLYVSLFDKPAGDTIGQLPNGAQIMPGEALEVKGEDWVHIWQGGLDGWVRLSQVWQLRDDLPLRFIQGAGGALLRQEPAGETLSALPEGSPVLLIETATTGGLEWAHVSLLDQRGGWVASHLLGEAP